MKTRQIVKDALKIRELEYSLTNIADDDKCEISDYSDEEIYKEAEYILYTFTIPGTMNNDYFLGLYEGEHEWEETLHIRKQFKQLKKFLEKYKNSKGAA